jgi:hypothetical protein
LRGYRRSGGSNRLLEALRAQKILMVRELVALERPAGMPEGIVLGSGVMGSQPSAVAVSRHASVEVVGYALLAAALSSTDAASVRPDPYAIVPVVSEEMRRLAQTLARLGHGISLVSLPSLADRIEDSIQLDPVPTTDVAQAALRPGLLERVAHTMYGAAALAAAGDLRPVLGGYVLYLRGICVARIHAIGGDVAVDFLAPDARELRVSASNFHGYAPELHERVLRLAQDPRLLDRAGPSDDDVERQARGLGVRLTARYMPWTASGADPVDWVGVDADGRPVLAALGGSIGLAGVPRLVAAIGRLIAEPALWVPGASGMPRVLAQALDDRARDVLEGVEIEVEVVAATVEGDEEGLDLERRGRRRSRRRRRGRSGLATGDFVSDDETARAGLRAREDALRDDADLDERSDAPRRFDADAERPPRESRGHEERDRGFSREDRERGFGRDERDRERGFGRDERDHSADRDENGARERDASRDAHGRGREERPRARDAGRGDRTRGERARGDVEPRRDADASETEGVAREGRQEGARRSGDRSRRRRGRGARGEAVESPPGLEAVQDEEREATPGAQPALGAAYTAGADAAELDARAELDADDFAGEVLDDELSDDGDEDAGVVLPRDERAAMARPAAVEPAADELEIADTLSDEDAVVEPDEPAAPAPPPRRRRNKAAIAVCNDPGSILTGLVLARERRNIPFFYACAQHELMDFLRGKATDIDEQTDLILVGFTAQPVPSETLAAARVYGQQLCWFDHHEWPVEDLERLREAIGEDAVFIADGYASPLALVQETTERRSRFTDKLLDFSGRRLSESDMEKWGYRLAGLIQKVAAAAGDYRQAIQPVLAGKPGELPEVDGVYAAEAAWLAEHHPRVVCFGEYQMVVGHVPSHLDVGEIGRRLRDSTGARISLVSREGDSMVLVGYNDERRHINVLGVLEQLDQKLSWLHARSAGDRMGRVEIEDLAEHPERIEALIGAIVRHRSVLQG